MTSRARQSPTLELLLAQLLSVGTWSACAIIAVGIAAQLTGHADIGSRIDRLGIGLFILLPVIRLTALAIGFARAREKWFAGICLLVVLIIALGTIEAMVIAH